MVVFPLTGCFILSCSALVGFSVYPFRYYQVFLLRFLLKRSLRYFLFPVFVLRGPFLRSSVKLFNLLFQCNVFSLKEIIFVFKHFYFFPEIFYILVTRRA